MSDDVPLTRAALRRRAAAAQAAEATPAPAPAPTPAAAPISVAERVLGEVAATALPLRRRSRAARTTAVAEVPAIPQAPASLGPSVVLPEPVEGPGPESAAEESEADEFERAAKAFCFTGETPVQAAAAAAGEQPPSARVRMSAQPRPRRGKIAFKRAAAASFSVSVVGVVGLLAVGTTTPVTAVAAFGPAARADISVVAPGTDSEQPEIQAYVAASDTKALGLTRSDEYDIQSMKDVAVEAGVTQFAGTWVNDATAEVQWPFPVGVPISAQFGSSSYLSKFSRAHHGTDFTPGAGAEIHAVAGGTVRIATEAGGDYGVTVVIDHIIDGELVSTRYGHMQYGSLRVAPGERVEAGDVIGHVGSTGKSTGAHLHLEVLLGGTTRIDPVPWLQQHTQG